MAGEVQHHLRPAAEGAGQVFFGCPGSSFGRSTQWSPTHRPRCSAAVRKAAVSITWA